MGKRTKYHAKRDQAIYRLVFVYGYRQADVAKLFGMTTQRIKQICRHPNWSTWLDMTKRGLLLYDGRSRPTSDGWYKYTPICEN